MHVHICSWSLISIFFIISVPVENVASISSSATVLEGVSRSRNALLNGNTRDYDWDSGYTCHQLGSGSIVVQLAQPYIIGSMRCVCISVCLCVSMSMYIYLCLCMCLCVYLPIYRSVCLYDMYIVLYTRLLLWDCDERTYTFYIDVSTDQKTWVRVADRTKQSCR